MVKVRNSTEFFPRSYNMGIRREVYQELGGFTKMRFGEDIDFSYRMRSRPVINRPHPRSVGMAQASYRLPQILPVRYTTAVLPALILRSAILAR
ncbi:hypothetical protein [Prevotella communis]|uniref:hypothetical protein n=1 Tax=Prevotella communis TaxID=2913614 RepID=UPI003D692D64